MQVSGWKRATLLALLICALDCGAAYAQAPTITSISPTSGPVGTLAQITGTNFGTTQGSSTVSLNGTNSTVVTWSSTVIGALVPSGATSGTFSVTVNSQNAQSTSFTITSVPAVWTDGDIGSVGQAGSASYSNGVFTVKGAGYGVWQESSDGMNFLSQPLSGDGTIQARIVSFSGGSSYEDAGVMIRETLSPGATNGFAGFFANSEILFSYRTPTGTTTSSAGSQAGLTLPYWVRLVRSGDTFTSYRSPDGLNWIQLGSQTLDMAQNAYIGLGVTSDSTSALATATFDNVSLSPAANPGPVITSVSATTGSVGSQVTISGSGFGSAGIATLNGTPLTLNSWSSTSVSATIPSGAASGYLVVSVAPNMNDSNPVFFTVTPQPLPSSWLDQDVGPVGLGGSATYSNGVFTVTGAGGGTYSGLTSDAIHFVYQPLSGDGTIVARVVSFPKVASYQSAGVMIRETLNSGATNGHTFFWGYLSEAEFSDRTSTGAGLSLGSSINNLSLPYWVKLVRSAGTFTGYACLDGLNWVQMGSTVTIDMAQNVYVGLAVTSGSATALATATFDNVSLTSVANPGPVISSTSATTGSIGSQVTLSGSGFGASQGNSLVLLGTMAMTINSWSDSSITLTIPSGAASGYLVVSVAPSMNDSNPVPFTVTTQPLTPGWLDQDIGQVGMAGSATYSGGVYTISGAGNGTYNQTTDGIHFIYQPLLGDGTIVARVVGISGGTSGYQGAGVMIRESLNPAATNGQTMFWGITSNSRELFTYRLVTGALTASASSPVGLATPYWVKLTRSGNSFSSYRSSDGINWAQNGSTETIVMNTSALVGLAVSSASTSQLTTATFDNVSVSATVSPGPVILSVSATTGSVGSQILISGAGFGASQGGSVVRLNGSSMTINAWSDSSITFTISSGATSGYLAVSVAPSMNTSNPVDFTVTSQPLPTPWLDQDVGVVGLAGSATYSGGVFTVKGAGNGTFNLTNDGIHFVYQPLPGDGTIIARVASQTGGAGYETAGVMIRETLNSAATSGDTAFWGAAAELDFSYRTTTGGTSTGVTGQASLTMPYWVKLVRSGNIFNSYRSSDGVNWSQNGTSQTITMATNVYVGLAVSSSSTTQLTTATLDNVSLTSGLMPFVISLSPASGPVATVVTVTGTSFGATQGTSTITFNGVAPASITSWNNTQIVATVPNTVTTGPVVVTVNSVASNSNVVFTAYNPVITSVTPPAAPIGGKVTISGRDFGTPNEYTNSVQFNGVVAFDTWNYWSDSSITAWVPQGATSGPVTVINNGVTSNGVSFTVLEAISVTGVSPSSGPLGSSVTISGAGFGPTQSNSTVTFNGANAAVTSWSDTSIAAVVPTGASTGPVTVSVAGFTGIGPSFGVTGSAQLTDSLGHQTSYSSGMVGGKWYVASGQGSGCSSCTQRGTVQNQFDNLGNVLSTTDELGRVTSYTYDSNDNVTKIVQPAVNGVSPTTTFTYNSFGEVLKMTDPLGNVTSNNYDSHGNLLSVTLPGPTQTTPPSITQFAYNSLGELTQITDPLGRNTTLTYTSAGLIATITDPQSHVTTYAYDTHGNRTSITDAMNNKTTFAYDSGDRLKTITYPDNSTTTFTYDSRGRRTSVTDQNGKTTSYAYDAADRLTSVTDAANNVTQYTYDTEGNLLSIEDANQHTTSFSYDAFGRVTQTTFPSNLSESYAYDGVGNLTSKTDRKNQTIQYVYDALNRLTQKTYPDSTNVEYTYDLAGKVSQVNDPTGTYAFAYDNMGRLIGTTTTYSFLPNTPFSNSYTYDANSNRTGFTAPDGSTNTYSYDTLNRLSTLANSWAGSFGFSYDALSRRTQMTRPNGIATNYSYDTQSRLLSVLHQLSGSTIDGATYTLDATGNRTAKTDNRANVTSNYTYDAIYQLTQVMQGTNTTESYTYDAVGNRLSSLGVSPYSYNSSNQLTAQNGVMYTYDNNGNTLTKIDSTGTTNYAWDYENRPASVTLPGSGGLVSLKYDPFGRRIQKVFTQNSTTTTTDYTYDGANTIEETDQNGNILARYSRTANIDEPLGASRSAATSFYEQDGLGSVTSLSNSAGALANTYTFDSFGKLTSSSGTLTNPFRYAARDSDSEMSLDYYRIRYYDPTAGRFISEDPGRFPGGINFYTYVENNPVDLVDPFGFCPWQVHSRPLKGFPGAGALDLDHYYFYNTLTGASIGLGPSKNTLTGPVPGKWERKEKPGHNVGPVPDWACNCVDKKAKNPGNPPTYCTLNGKPQAGAANPCLNCMGWVNSVLQDCYNQAYAGQQ